MITEGQCISLETTTFEKLNIARGRSDRRHYNRMGPTFVTVGSRVLEGCPGGVKSSLSQQPAVVTREADQTAATGRDMSYILLHIKYR